MSDREREGRRKNPLLSQFYFSEEPEAKKPAANVRPRESTAPWGSSLSALFFLSFSFFFVFFSRVPLSRSLF